MKTPGVSLSGAARFSPKHTRVSPLKQVLEEPTLVDGLHKNKTRCIKARGCGLDHRLPVETFKKQTLEDTDSIYIYENTVGREATSTPSFFLSSLEVGSFTFSNILNSEKLWSTLTVTSQGQKR